MSRFSGLWCGSCAEDDQDRHDGAGQLDVFVALETGLEHRYDKERRELHAPAESDRLFTGLSVGS